MHQWAGAQRSLSAGADQRAATAKGRQVGAPPCHGQACVPDAKDEQVGRGGRRAHGLSCTHPQHWPWPTPPAGKWLCVSSLNFRLSNSPQKYCGRQHVSLHGQYARTRGHEHVQIFHSAREHSLGQNILLAGTFSTTGGVSFKRDLKIKTYLICLNTSEHKQIWTHYVV